MSEMPFVQGLLELFEDLKEIEGMFRPYRGTSPLKK